MINGNIGGIIMPHWVTAKNGCAFPPPVKTDMAPVLMDKIFVFQMTQALTYPVCHIGWRSAIGLGNRVMHVFSDFLKADHIHALLYNRIGNNMHFPFMLMHGVKRAVTRMLLICV